MSVKVIQIRIGPRASDELKEWVENQGDDANENAKRVLEHFISLYGTMNINDTDVKVKMYQDFLKNVGVAGNAASPPEKTVEVNLEQPIVNSESVPNVVPVEDNKSSALISDSVAVEKNTIEEIQNTDVSSETEEIPIEEANVKSDAIQEQIHPEKTDESSTKETEKKPKPVTSRGQISI